MGRAGAGRRARAAQLTHPAAVPAPRPRAGRRAGGHRRRVHGGQWAPIVTAAAPLLGMWLSSEKLRSASLRTKKSHGDARFQEGPRGAGAWVPKDKGTPPASLTPTLNLVRPPLLVPTSRPSPARHGGRLSEMQGHQTAPPLRGRGPRLLGSGAWGEGCVLSVSSSLPLELLPKPGEWIWHTGDARGCRLSEWAREQPTLQVFPVHGEVFPFPRVPKRDLPKAGPNGWRLRPTRHEAPVAQLPAGNVKFRPWRHLCPPVIQTTAAARPAPPPGGCARTWLVNFLNPSLSPPPGVFGLGFE